MSAPLGLAGDGKDPNEAGGDVLGADVGADVPCHVTGVEDGGDGLKELGAGLGLGDSGGTTIGYAAVQIARHRGARVITTAGDTYASELRDLGAIVTPYGDGMVERVAAISDGPVDLVLDTAPVGGALSDLVQIAGGDPKRVLTISHFREAEPLGVRDSFHEQDQVMRFHVFGEFTQLAAEGRFTIPIAQTFALDDWRTALDISLTGHARGKLLLLPNEDTGN